MSVVVAVLTYQRPADLAEVLPELVRQAGECAVPATVLVVDNDPAGSARDLVEAHPGVRYAHEERPGIAAARNRALDEAGDAGVLVFIDDDERPAASWLKDLLATRAATGATAVVGPVVSEYDGELDPWVSAGRFFDRRRLDTGAPVVVAATNNLLLDLPEVRRLGVRFDERFGLSGGSDTLFTRELVRSGGTMVWCDEALVVDRVPAARMTRDWVLRRALRSGNGWSRTSLALARSRRERVGARAVLTARGGVRALAGAGQLALGTALRRPGHQARGARTLARGAGMVSGAYGYAYVEYRRPAAPPS